MKRRKEYPEQRRRRVAGERRARLPVLLDRSALERKLWAYRREHPRDRLGLMTVALKHVYGAEKTMVLVPPTSPFFAWLERGEAA